MYLLSSLILLIWVFSFSLLVRLTKVLSVLVFKILTVSLILHNYFCFHLIDFCPDLSYFFLLILYLVCSCLSKAQRCVTKLFIWVFFNFLVQVYINFPLRVIFIVSYRLWYFVFIFIWFCEIFHLIFDFSLFEMCCLKFTRLYIGSRASLALYSFVLL